MTSIGDTGPTIGSKVGSLILGFLMIATGAATTWISINRRRGGTLTRWGDELSMPCKHAVRKLEVLFERDENPRASGNVAVVLVCRCAACGQDRLGDFAILSESDGRIIIENTTAQGFDISIDGEMHHLEPHGRQNRRAHIVRRATASFDDSMPDDDDDIITDIRDPDEGDRG